MSTKTITMSTDFAHTVSMVVRKEIQRLQEVAAGSLEAGQLKAFRYYDNRINDLELLALELVRLEIDHHDDRFLELNEELWSLGFKELN